MRVIRGHKSMNVFKVDFHGIAAHSSLPGEGLNAISYATRFARFVDEVSAELRQGERDEAFIEPTTTMNVNRIDGGIAVNTIPALCTVFFEYRSLASVDREALTARMRAEAERLQDEMRQVNPAGRVDFSIQAGAPGLDTTPEAGSWNWPPAGVGNRLRTRSLTAPRPACSPAPGSPPWSAAPATSPRRTPRMSSLNCPRSPRANSSSTR